MPSALTPAGESHGELSNLNFMRACAVLMVFFGSLAQFHGMDHLGPLNLAELTLCGVLLFCVHTGFVLMLSLERRWHDQGSRHLFTHFLVRRCFRVLPLSVFVVSLVAIFGLPLMSLDAHHFYGATLSSTLVISNLLLIQNLTKTSSILAPLWCLPFELQTCLLLPFLFLFLRAARSTWRLILLYAASLVFALMAINASGMAATLRTIPLLFTGVIAYQIQRKKVSRLPAFLWPLSILALTIIFLEQNHIGLLNGLTAQEFGIYATALILALLVPRFAQISNRWVVATSHTIAKYSYGIYLTHFFTIWLAMEQMSHLPKIYRFGTLLVLSAGLPVLFYHGLEEPMTAYGKQLVGRKTAPTSPAATLPKSQEPRYVPVSFPQT